ncbi:hypothetical protein CC78DRAFT_574348 [Lojkania enalia]|uniref:Uncharacterized protein n=1 Tax=Lojkania enalia TaxID=147567 RepID=A0A9P4TR98_9PLEO|nr:hypothetical protein CC78DRAFT_574348 [Didymosphaeria enalia]
MSSSHNSSPPSPARPTSKNPLHHTSGNSTATTLLEPPKMSHNPFSNRVFCPCPYLMLATFFWFIFLLPILFLFSFFTGWSFYKFKRKWDYKAKKREIKIKDTELRAKRLLEKERELKEKERELNERIAGARGDLRGVAERGTLGVRSKEVRMLESAAPWRSRAFSFDSGRTRLPVKGREKSADEHRAKGEL